MFDFLTRNFFYINYFLKLLFFGNFLWKKFVLRKFVLKTLLLKNIRVKNMVPFQACKAIGARSLHINSQSEQDAISRYFSEWTRAGVSRIWMEISDLDPDHPKPNSDCNFRYPDAYATPPFTNYAQNEPHCEEMSNSCIYISTTTGNWKASNCAAMEAFACEVEPGTMIHSVPKPTNQYHCHNVMGYSQCLEKYGYARYGYAKWAYTYTDFDQSIRDTRCVFRVYKKNHNFLPFSIWEPDTLYTVLFETLVTAPIGY